MCRKVVYSKQVSNGNWPGNGSEHLKRENTQQRVYPRIDQETSDCVCWVCNCLNAARESHVNTWWDSRVQHLPLATDECWEKGAPSSAPLGCQSDDLSLVVVSTRPGDHLGDELLGSILG